MKKITLIIFILFATVVTGQDSTKSKTFKIKITDEVIRNGYLAAFSDSGLMFSAQPVSFSPYSVMKNIDKQIAYQDVKKAFVRRKGSTGRGILIGTVSGALLGGLMGFASGPDDDCENQFGTIGGVAICYRPMSAGDKATVGSIFFGLSGGIVGAIIGALTGKEFLIEGKKENFNALRANLTKRTTKNRFRKSAGPASF